MNPVVHFEMPYEDRERMASFYQKVFGWKTQMTGPEMGNYVVAQTTETDENNMVQKPGTINGGFFEKNSENSHPSVVISVDDIHASMKAVQEAGGTIVTGKTQGEPVEIPGIGLYVSFIDPEGNKVSLLQPKER